MNYLSINKCDTANGKGVRVTLFTAGCRLHCPGCFNPESWNFEAGKPFTRETEDEIIEALRPLYCSGLTLCGGEPFEPENREALLYLCKRVRNELPTKNVWAFSGRYYEELIAPPFNAADLLEFVDVLVEGPFEEDKKDLSLAFRGSSNQKITKLKGGKPFDI